MALDGFLVLERPDVGESADAQRRRLSTAAPNDMAARRPAAPSRRLAAVRMAPSTFLWLISGWMAGLAILAAVVLVLRSFA